MPAIEQRSGRDAGEELRPGDPVEVKNRYHGGWTRGFDVVAVESGRCRLRRRSDGTVLPLLIDCDLVRADRRVGSTSAHPPRVRHAWTHSGGLVVGFPPELDVHSSPSVFDTVLELVDRASSDVVFDLADVEFIDSFGIRSLIHARRRAWERDLTVRLRGARPLVQALFDLVGMDPHHI